MKLTYIYHSGFTIEAENCVIIIDFFKDSDTMRKGIVHDYFFNSPKQIYVLATHSHTDHFNKEILDWKALNPNVKCILSKEIANAGLVSVNENVILLDKLQEYSDLNIWIKAFGSTDIGGSFLIKCGDRAIYHAGDLNNWHWDEESTPEEIKEAESAYLKELDILSREVKSLDLAMFPVDARLGKNYMKGARQFVDTIKVGLFTPMHFGKDYEKAHAFKVYAENIGIKFFTINDKGDSIEF